MGVDVKKITETESLVFPNKGDFVEIHYIGWLKDENAPDKKGAEFDSSRKRGRPLRVAIGTGQVIQGWDEGVPQLRLGEKALLTITGDYAYGEGGFPGLIPPMATLLFEVELVSVNGQTYKPTNA
ncbi:FK506 binding protein proline rotamase rapamycin-binding protein [Aspergillus hancockii]|nr:FK506 binding protein proline rotamase rapamycin-binding protein [Aspergillus hancockii]